jgi:tetratricopeptide (TPR) repeat protein
VAGSLIVLAGLGAYVNSFSGPFIYDDVTSIVNNRSIRDLRSIGRVLSPPRNGETVSGRPLLNLSFAIDYAIGGTSTWNYHATNLAIHVFNGLLLLGILRRTLCLPVLKPQVGDAALGVALAISLLWMLHPLQTESVTYIVQRAESLAAMFYLLVIYCVIRGMETPRGGPWYILAVAACLLGVATKESVATAPVLVLLYDRTLVSGSFRDSLRRRWGLYLGLAASWGLFFELVWSAGLVTRQGEFGVIDAWSYARSQPGVVLHYLRLALWPDSLCFNYAWPVAHRVGEILPGALAIGLLGTATVWELRKGRGWGILGAWFFLMLAPTSSIMPLKQLAFEHRMYLPLAAVVTLVVAGGFVAGQYLIRTRWVACRVCPVVGVICVALAAVALGLLTRWRNEVYRTELSIWQDTVAKAPHNAYAQGDLANALVRAGRSAEALEPYERAIRLRPDFAEGHNNWGNALFALGRPSEAIEHYQEAMRLKPRHAVTHNNWGNALRAIGRQTEALEHYREAVRLKPDEPVTHYNWAEALSSLGRHDEAIEHYEQAIRLKPDDAAAHTNWGNALLAMGRPSEAIEHYRQTLQFRPDHAEAHNNWGNALSALGRQSEAVDHYRQAIRIKPDHAGFQLNACLVLQQVGRIREAVDHGREAVCLMPGAPAAHQVLGWLLATHEESEGGNPADAVKFAERACVLTDRRDIACLDTLAAAYASAGRFGDAVSAAKEAWQMAQSAGDSSLAEEIHIRLQLYRDRKPYRVPTVLPTGRHP